MQNILLNIKPREYQQKIFETAKKDNTLIVLPTGLGKTLIGLMLSIERIKEFPGKKILFLAPTKPLVEQHLNYFKKNLPELFADLQIFTGTVPSEKREKIFQTAEIIFSTPQCIANDLRAELYNLTEVVLLIIDEAHRCLKNYDYTNVVNFYKSQGINKRILGMTASPGSDLEKVRQICQNLDIKNFEIRNRDSEDVKPYLEERTFQKVSVPFPQEFIEIRILFKKIFSNKVEQLKKRNLLFGPANKISLLKLQNNLARQISSRNFNAMIGMSLTAQAIKISHAIELLETQTISGLNEYLKGLIQQADQKKSKGVQTLVNSPEFKASLISLKDLLGKKIEHPKIEEVSVLVENEFKENPSSKIIIFSQFRETASKISERIKKIPNVNSSIFIGQAKKKESGLSQKDQKRIIEEFREGKINVICSTSIGEEGLDIPEVSAVIFYEPIPSAIRKIQREGRTARLSPGKLIILITKDTRDEINHFASSVKEKKMYKNLEIVKEEIKNLPKTLDEFKL